MLIWSKQPVNVGDLESTGGLADALPDCVDGVQHLSWSKAVSVWLEYRLPFRLNDHFHQCVGSVHHRGYTSASSRFTGWESRHGVPVVPCREVMV